MLHCVFKLWWSRDRDGIDLASVWKTTCKTISLGSYCCFSCIKPISRNTVEEKSFCFILIFFIPRWKDVFRNCSVRLRYELSWCPGLRPQWNLLKHIHKTSTRGVYMLTEYLHAFMFVLKVIHSIIFLYWVSSLEHHIFVVKFIVFFFYFFLVYQKCTNLI